VKIQGVQLNALSFLLYNVGVSAHLLAIKIGNSNITVGIFANADLIARWRMQTQLHQTADEYAILLNEFFAQAKFTPNTWRGAAMVSVVPALTATFQDLCRRYFEIDPLIATAALNTGMPLKYENPNALGADRWVAALAAKAKFGAPVIVIDFGTATTFNAVNRAGEFIGGAIAPGLNLAADALYRATAQLPRVDLALPPRAIATNTVHAIQAGIVFGYLGMIEGMVARMRAELGEPNARVIATGGLAPLLAPQTQAIDAVERDLVLDGLRLLFELHTGGQ
jgi:type III pantothenate kinase